MRCVTHDVEWQEEEFYFGNAVYPSRVFYRKHNDHLQCRVDQAFYPHLEQSLRGRIAREKMWRRIWELLFKLENRIITIEKDERRNECPVIIFVVGWKDLEEDERDCYERDKSDCMKIWGR